MLFILISKAENGCLFLCFYQKEEIVQMTLHSCAIRGKYYSLVMCVRKSRLKLCRWPSLLKKTAGTLFPMGNSFALNRISELRKYNGAKSQNRLLHNVLLLACSKKEKLLLSRVGPARGCSEMTRAVTGG